MTFKKKIKQLTSAPVWQVEKKISLAVVLTVLLQSSAGIWWAATQTEVQNFQDRRLNDLEGTLVIQTAQQSTLGERLGRIEERVALLLDGMERIEKRLER